jgi:DNA polymerase (family 10)
MKNKELSRIFAEIADALEFKGENRFKIIAYRRASGILEDLTEDIEVTAKKRWTSRYSGRRGGDREEDRGVFSHREN